MNTILRRTTYIVNDIDNPNNKEYIIESLPKEAKELLDGLRVAERQIKIQEDNLKLISFSKLKMLEALKEILKDVEPLNEN